MNCKTTNAILTFVLGAFVLLDIVFALQSITRTRELRSLQYNAAQAQAGLVRVQQLQAVYNDAIAYSQKNPEPELKRILQGPQTKPVNK